jgi:hypothetical protein
MSEKSQLETKLLEKIHEAGLPEPAREVRFDAQRRWKFDFAWADWSVAAECEGAIWSFGRHVRGKGYEEDCRKYNYAALHGWSVYRFTADMIANGEALDVLERALR